MKPVCVPCQRFFRPTNNGLPFIEQMPRFNGATPGTAEPEAWKPYKLWLGDQWTCHGCGAVIIIGVAREPLSEHYRPDFETFTKNLGAEVTVNDC